MTGKPLKQRPMPFEGLRITGMNAVAFATTNVARVGHDHPFDVMAARAVDETLKRQALVPGVGRVIDDRTVGQRLHHTWHPEHLVGRLVVQEHEDRGRACSQRGFGALAQVSASGDERRGLAGRAVPDRHAPALPEQRLGHDGSHGSEPDHGHFELEAFIIVFTHARGLLIIVLADVQQVSGLRFNTGRRVTLAAILPALPRPIRRRP